MGMSILGRYGLNPIIGMSHVSRSAGSLTKVMKEKASPLRHQRLASGSFSMS